MLLYFFNTRYNKVNTVVKVNMISHMGTFLGKARARTDHVISRFCDNHVLISLTIWRVSFSDHNILVKKGII